MEVNVISFIKGTVVDIEEDKIVLECNGIGYNIFVSGSLISKVNSLKNDILIYTYLSVREDAMNLFGFISKEELNIFKKLISVSGIGPKGALGILSTLTVSELKIAIISDDSKAIAKSPGIGAKTASKVILELKDKIDLENAFQTSSETNIYINDVITELQKDALDALVSLGYSSSQSLNAIKKALNTNSQIANASELIKISLKFI